MIFAPLVSTASVRSFRRVDQDSKPSAKIVPLYANLHGDAMPDELRILSLDEVLDYLTSAGNYRCIIEIKDDGKVGLAAANQLYAALNTQDLLDLVIVGSFHDEVEDYTTANYLDMHRSASPEEVVQFYFAALTGKKEFTWAVLTRHTRRFSPRHAG